MAAAKSAKYGIAAVVVALAIIAAALAVNPNGPVSSITSSIGSHSSSQGSVGSQSSSASGGQYTTTSSAGQSAQQTSSQSASSSTQVGSGTLNVYIKDAPPSDKTLKYLLVNATSVELSYEGSVSNTTATATSTTTGVTTFSTTMTQTSILSSSSGSGSSNTFTYAIPAGQGTDINLTSLQGNSLLLGSTDAPTGNVTRVTISLTGAEAFYTDGSSASLKVVANGKLMVPIHFEVQPGSSTDLTFDLTPNLVHISAADVLSPVIHVTAVGTTDSRTVTTTAQVDESQTSTTTTTT